MSFWSSFKPKPKPPSPHKTSQPALAKNKVYRSPPISFEAKMLAIEALDCGADREDVAQVLGVRPTTVHKWVKLHQEQGISGLCRKPSNKTVRKQ